MRRPGNIFYTIIVFTRRDPPEIWRRKGVETGSWRSWRKEVKKGRQRRDEARKRKRVDNSQDRIVPRAKNPIHPEVLSDGRDAREPSTAPHPLSENASRRKLLYSRGVHMAVPTAAPRHP